MSPLLLNESQPCKSNNFFLKISTSSYYNFIPLFSNIYSSPLRNTFIPRSYWESKIPDMRNKYLPQSQTLIHEDEHTNEVTGFISLINNYIAALFVPPDRQGQGIGQTLMAHVKQQHPELELNVYAENTQALAFYKRQGFTVTREQTDEQTGRQEFTMKYQRGA